MGSSSSRPGLNPSQGSRINRFSRLSSSLFICGSRSSRAPLEMEDYPTEIVKSAEQRDSVKNMVQNPLEESTSVRGTETRFWSTGTETVTSAGTNIEANGEPSIEGGSREVETSNSRKCLTESMEMVVPQSVALKTRAHLSFVPSRVFCLLKGLKIRLGYLLRISDESIRETIPSGLGFLLSNREQGQGDARRNDRRLFWDAIQRHSSRRLNDSPSIFLSTDDRNDTSVHDRWLLNVSGDIFFDGAGDESGYLSSSRIHSLNERRQHSRSEIWERLLGGHDENSQQTTFCPSGLHPDGTCSCDSLLMTDESSARASISRIVMLAEALFEVLDEIHYQPVSLSLSMVSVPAPESVVDSFPLRNHKKVDASKDGDVVEQCYICLSEYEEEEKIRVLPCQHEFHMSCVDKWLKEIQGVCPLCRGDVRQGVDSPVSNSEVPSL
ncbi:hypothetical protein V6N12_007265 [Hibiscus sabdariffa]|uniref:RING-type domain-containing protein n=1 Tax=Hibiscus sabdariffa TaxID=183260 RepID=A0ABR2F1A1_9ROSI